MECLFSDFRSKKHKKILVFSSLIRTFAPDKSIFLAYSYLCT